MLTNTILNFIACLLLCTLEVGYLLGLGIKVSSTYTIGRRRATHATESPLQVPTSYQVAYLSSVATRSLQQVNLGTSPPATSASGIGKPPTLQGLSTIRHLPRACTCRVRTSHFSHYPAQDRCSLCTSPTVGDRPLSLSSP